MCMKKFIFFFGVLAPFLSFCQWTQMGSTIEGSTNSGHLGYSMSLSEAGTTMAIGVPLAPGSGYTIEDRSYVQVFTWQSGDWVQLGDDILGGESFLSAPNGNFFPPNNGTDLVLSPDGKTLAMAEPGYYYVNPDNEGEIISEDRARVFEYVGGQWQQVGNDIYGDARSIAMSDDVSTVAIGRNYDSTMATQSGVVQVFQNINNEWVQVGDTFYGTISYERLGESIALSSDGTVLAIGATGGAGGGLSPDPGYVNIYNLQNSIWVLDETIIGLPSDDGWGRGSYCGASVALSPDGTKIAISSSQYRNEDNEHVGNVRVFQNTGGSWQQVGETLEGAKSSHENTKSMVDISNDGQVLAFGSTGSFSFFPPSSSPGNYKVYRNNNDQWELVDQIITPETAIEEDDDRFGQVVSLSADGSILGIGSFGAEANGETYTGIAKVYQSCNLTDISVLAEDTEAICSGQSTVLSAMIEQDYYLENGVVNWYENLDDTVAVFTGNIYETPEIDETTSFWVEGVSPIGCPSERVEVVIDPNSKAEPEVAFSYDTICTTDTSVLPDLSQDFRTGGTFYTSSSLVVDSATGAIDASNSQSGTHIVTYEVEEDTGNCIDAGTYQFEVLVEACTIQRGISPNNDGLNDAFDLTGYNVNKLRIYNRHGKEIYSKTNYTNQWEGQDNNGNDLPTGTYFYSIDKNNDEQLTGWVYINREL